MRDGWIDKKISDRKEYKKNIKIVIILDIIIGIVFYKILYETNYFTFLQFILSYLFTILFANAVALTPTNHSSNIYNSLYKQEVIDKLLNNFFDDVDYIPNKKMPNQIYDDCQKYKYYDIYESDDYMEGFIDDKYLIRMAEVNTIEEVTEKDSDGNKETHEVTVFSGLFAKIDIQKSIQGELVIKQNGQIFGKDKLEMDSSEFEKYFDVSSSDKIKGMQLLTHDIMELLIIFRTQWGINYDIVIRNNGLYIRLHTGSMFESIFNDKEAIDKATTRKYYDTIDFIYSLAKEIIKNVEETQI